MTTLKQLQESYAWLAKLNAFNIARAHFLDLFADGTDPRELTIAEVRDAFLHAAEAAKAVRSVDPAGDPDLTEGPAVELLKLGTEGRQRLLERACTATGLTAAMRRRFEAEAALVDQAGPKFWEWVRLCLK